jgi:hypothetical protein
MILHNHQLQPVHRFVREPTGRIFDERVGINCRDCGSKAHHSASTANLLDKRHHELVIEFTLERRESDRLQLLLLIIIGIEAIDRRLGGSGQCGTRGRSRGVVSHRLRYLLLLLRA